MPADASAILCLDRRLRRDESLPVAHVVDELRAQALATKILRRHWQLAGLYERASLRPDAGTLYASLPDQLKRHEALGAALNFWATSDVVFKLNGYSVNGNQSARSANAALDALTGKLDDHTLVLVVGAQFSF